VVGVRCFTKTKLQHIIQEMWKIAGSRVTNNGAFFIQGGSGTYETLIADLKHWSAEIFCVKNLELSEYDLNGLDESISKIHLEIKPTKKKPLVCILCDVDKKLEKLMKEEKLDYDRFCRERSRFYTLIHHFVDIPYFPNTILIMISNKPKAYLDELDTSFLREGRVDKCWEFTHDMITFYTYGAKEKDE
jgi:hypothetical protein